MQIGNDQDRVRWLYNNKDIDYTLQVANRLQEVLENQSPKLLEFLDFQLHELAPALVNVMKRGVRVDLAKKEELRSQLAELMVSVEYKLEWLIGEPFNPKSFPQVKALFKDLLKVDPVQNAKGTDTFGAEAMGIYLEDYPLLRPLITLILEYRTLQVFVGTFLSAKVDDDGRMRCSYNAAGTSTYRLSSRKNAFGNGMNLQNVPSKGKLDLDLALTSLASEGEHRTTMVGEGITELPNCKELFIPDEKYTFFDVDYCLTEDHEILTLNGWVNIREFVEQKQKVPIACWLQETGKIYWDMPVEYIEKLYKGDIYTFEGKTSLRGSGNHRQPMMSDNGVFRCNRFNTLYTGQGANSRYIHSANVDGCTILASDTYLQLLVAMQADGCFMYKGSSYVRFSFRKQRKIDRLRSLLDREGVAYRERYDRSLEQHHFYLDSEEPITAELLVDLGRDKTFPNWLLQLDSESIALFVEELGYWDGKQEKLENYSYSSTNYENIKLVQALCCLCSKYSAYSTYTKETFKPVHSLYISSKTLSQDRSTKRTKEKFTGVIYCVTSPTNYIVVRRKGKVTITGNSGADAMVVAWDSRCEWLMNFFSTQKMKLYVYVAQEYLQRELDTNDPLYKKYKAFVHLTNYGGGVAKAAVTAGMPLGEAKKLQKFYFDLCPELPIWHKRVEADIHKKGYIENIFGARGYFLDKRDHNLLNKAYAYIPQSSIGIMVNKGLVSIEKEAKQYAQGGGVGQQEAVEVLLQVHDSLAGQFKTSDVTAPDRIIKHMSIELPYETPLVIPVDIATSTHSYGRC